MWLLDWLLESFFLFVRLAVITSIISIIGVFVSALWALWNEVDD